MPTRKSRCREGSGLSRRFAVERGASRNQPVAVRSGQELGVGAWLLHQRLRRLGRHSQSTGDVRNEVDAILAVEIVGWLPKRAPFLDGAQDSIIFGIVRGSCSRLTKTVTLSSVVTFQMVVAFLT